MATDGRGADARLTIDLGAIVGNYRALANRVAPAECAAVVKADAYGLGMARVAPALARAGARTFFVAQLGEALTLRDILPDATVGVFNGLTPGAEATYANARLLPVLNHLGEIDRWTAVARRTGRTLPAFVHIDTGMNRLGLPAAEVDALAADPDRLAGIAVDSYLSHLACADEADHPMTDDQARRFAAALSRLPPGRASLANSSGIFRGSDYHLGLVRPGCALYGVNPTPEAANPMAQPVHLTARVLQVRAVDSPATVGYGAAHTVQGPSKIATIAAGYADGYLRSLSGRGQVLLDGALAPIVGRVSMDLITVDVTHLHGDRVRPGDMAELIGPHRTADAVAAEAGTIGYEILTALGARYDRHYIDVDATSMSGAAP